MHNCTVEVTALLHSCKCSCMLASSISASRVQTALSSGSQGSFAACTDGLPNGATCVALQCFSEGCALLSRSARRTRGGVQHLANSGRLDTMANAKQDNARHLREHYLPPYELIESKLLSSCSSYILGICSSYLEEFGSARSRPGGRVAC